MPEAAHVGSGKVRELYALDDERLLLVASDRISTFDVVLPTEIPDKGRVLTGLSAFWFARTSSIVPNHLLGLQADGRSSECRRLEMLPLECVVRGYITGSGWKDYQATGATSGHTLPPGSRIRPAAGADLHPSTKADEGTTRTSTSTRPASSSGPSASQRWSVSRSSSTALRRSTRSTRGIIIADTKFEFGVDGEGRLVLADEAFTPDSSRFWPRRRVRARRAQPSFDKQFVRDYCESLGWDKTLPGPSCPMTWSQARARATSRPSKD
jgi:phosphoribosylaminoimidazole-succinocarboxamide synthase